VTSPGPSPHTGGSGRFSLARGQQKSPELAELQLPIEETTRRNLTAGQTYDAHFRRCRQFHPSIVLAPPKYRVHSDAALSEERTVSLIFYYVAFMIGGAFAAYFLGLLVEYEWGAHVSLIVFLAVYFFSLWVAWMLAVWVTRPRDAASSAR
jgi:hypothetical protein